VIPDTESADDDVAYQHGRPSLDVEPESHRPCSDDFDEVSTLLLRQPETRPQWTRLGNVVDPKALESAQPLVDRATSNPELVGQRRDWATRDVLRHGVRSLPHFQVTGQLSSRDEITELANHFLCSARLTDRLAILCTYHRRVSPVILNG
jgi:hypothetical protein